MSKDKQKPFDPAEAYEVPEDQRVDHDDETSTSLQGGADDQDLHLYRLHPGAVIQEDLG